MCLFALVGAGEIHCEHDSFHLMREQLSSLMTGEPVAGNKRMTHASDIVLAGDNVSRCPVVPEQGPEWQPVHGKRSRAVDPAGQGRDVGHPRC